MDLLNRLNSRVQEEGVIKTLQYDISVGTDVKTGVRLELSII